MMKPWQRALLALLVVVIDTAVVYVPLTGLFAAYVILAHPTWFLRFVGKIYRIADRG